MIPAGDPLRHRLSAVWFADLVGYSGLSFENEAAALRLVHLLQVVARETIDRFGGQAVKFLGDGVLAAFGSTEDAVDAALALQREFASRSAAAGSGASLRVGVHLGDVASAPDGDLYGDGVNIAARLQPEAKPGQVVVSEDVWRQLRHRPEQYRFQAGSERRLRGIAEPMRVFAVCAPDEENAPGRPELGMIPGTSRWRATHFRSQRRRRWMLVLVAGVVATAALLRSGNGRGASDGLDANRVAVAPFNVRSSDPELRHWDE